MCYNASLLERGVYRNARYNVILLSSGIPSCNSLIPHSLIILHYTLHHFTLVHSGSRKSYNDIRGKKKQKLGQ